MRAREDFRINAKDLLMGARKGSKLVADWQRLLNGDRRRTSRMSLAPLPVRARAPARTQMERDYDRILFCTPVRRMADKTQVFPLEAHDAVHTRLTHSLEVSALARSMGIDLVSRFARRIGLQNGKQNLREIPALLAAVGLVHDIGNPPFGHQGEDAIRNWFSTNRKEIFQRGHGLAERLQQDFLRFEGNAQTFRLVTKLQLQGDEYGLNLSYGTLATLLKYTATATAARKNHRLAGRHKPGYFASERTIAQEVWSKTGLKSEQRHPLAYLVEACDDIAYGVMDTEDTVKKNIASFPDVQEHLLAGGGNDPVTEAVLEYACEERKKLVRSTSGRYITPHELDDLSMQHFRVISISQMVESALNAFVDNFRAICAGSFKDDLLGASKARVLRDSLASFRSKITFPHRSVLEVELSGSQVIHELMDKLWVAIVGRERRKDLSSKRRSRLAAYTYSRISENYRRVFEHFPNGFPIRYREAQLLTDMISGMTDSFAISLLAELRHFDTRGR